MPTDRGVNKEDVVHAYNGALFSHKKEQNKKPPKQDGELTVAQIMNPLLQISDLN